jgi:hypothetical protein
VLRTTSPQDRKAILDWVDYHAVARELVESLPSLKDGEAWICSPHFLGVVERVRIRRRRTFDSGATPVAGQSRKATRLADIDLGALQARMAETVERAQADDPKVLRKQIAELKREAAKRSTETQVETVTETVEVPVLADADLDRLAEIVDGLSAGAGKIVSAANEISAALGKLQVRRSAPPVPRPQPTAPVARPPAPTPREQPASDDSLALGKAHRAILGVLAQREGQATSKRQLAVATGYAIGGGGFNNPLGALRTAGLIDGRDPIFITPAGTAAIDGQYEPLPTGPDLLEHWCRLGKAHGLILRALAERYPESMSKQELADATGYEAAGGGFNNPLGKLRTLELIEGRSDLRLTDALGEELLAA